MLPQNRHARIHPHDITHQALVARCVLTHNRSRITHAVVLQKHALDLAQLDPETTNLHLPVDAAEQFDTSIGRGTAEITCAIYARARFGVLKGSGTKPSAVRSGRPT